MRALVRDARSWAWPTHETADARTAAAPEPHPGFDRVARARPSCMYNALAYVLAGPLTFGPIGWRLDQLAGHVLPAAAGHPGRDGAVAVPRVVPVRFAMTSAGGLAPGTLTAATALNTDRRTTRGDPVSLHVLGAPLAGLVGAVPAADGGGFESPTTAEFYQPLIGDGAVRDHPRRASSSCCRSR